MAPRVRRLTAAVVERCAAEVPFYRALPRETLDGEVTRSVNAVFGLLLRALREPEAVGPAEVTWLIEWSARRAEERVPLEAALTAYLIGAEVWWRALAECAAPGELAEAGAGLLGCLHTAVPAVALAHLQAQEAVRGEDRRLRRALLAALLGGQPYEALAEGARMAVGGAYEVVALGFGQSPSARLVQSALDAHMGALVLVDHAAGVALLPDAPDLPGLVTRLGQDVGTPVHAAAARAGDPSDIPAAADEARRVLDLVRRLGRPPGLYRFDDVLVEYQLARPGDGLVRLAAKLDPLEDHPHLLETLRAFVGHGHNRRQTALDLHIHRNTLDYRLQRVTALTGLDPAVPAQSLLLGAALTARDLA
ncbi:helix-turn-helix domain-containing protein [Nonomuraea sp. NBC_01738]|uniref:PucR family transcriptional regulator n=1 Tax=Nonomuraea sp. NBC_01738 TaxID=2976003 RepID=UPI002E0EFE76|nr:helix-turn-helix domain-containing protein [Nonomuraea sp. NBC_01738]